MRHRDAIHPQLQLFTITGQGIDTLQQWLFDDWFITYLKSFQLWRNSMEDLLGEISQRLQLDRLINEHLQDLEELIIVPHLALHQIAFAALPIGLGVGEGENQGDVNSIDSDSLITNENKKNDDLSNSSRSTRMVINFGEDVKVRKIDPKTETKTKTANLCLGDRFRLRIIPSLQILNYCHERETLNPCSMGIVENATEDLVFTPYECETIAQEYSNFKATASGTIAQGFSVLKRLKGKDAIADQYYKVSHEVSILHSSHHASFNPNDPLNSLLLLADQELRLGELINWRTPKLLDVFLSCCETNVNSPKLTDDVLTLATAFLCIGARNVVCTQWAVDDFASALITVFYYQFRQQNNSRPRALQLAQTRLRELSKEELNTKYKDSLHNYCIQQKQYYIELKQTANNNKNEKLSQKLEQLIKKLDNQIKITLPYHCQQKQPFKSPYYWSGFTCQGLT